MQFLRPSQDAPDASVSSVCVQGDQDTGRMGRRVLAGWAWRRNGEWGEVIMETRAACRAGRHLPASVHLPRFPEKPRPHVGLPVAVGTTQTYADRSDGPMGLCGCVRMHVGMSLQACTCGQVCMHTYVPGCKWTCRGLNT